MKTSEKNFAVNGQLPTRPATSALVSSKLETRHLSLQAIVYVRQSSMRQVRENIESTQLQYSLVRRMELFGWQPDRIEVIDDDLGISGSSIQGRSGFPKPPPEYLLVVVGAYGN